MAENSRKPTLPGGVTPYAVGATLLALITIFSFIGSVPWVSHSELTALQASWRLEIDGLKAEISSLRRYQEALEVARREAVGHLSSHTNKLVELERRIGRLENAP
jgi:hypothetical protein